MFEIREYKPNDMRNIDNSYVILADGFVSQEDAERELSQRIIRDFDLIEIAEVVSIKIDKEAAGYLVDLLSGHVGGRATLDTEPLGRIRLALNAVRFSEGPDAFDRRYLVNHPTDQKYPNLARPDDLEALRSSERFRKTIREDTAEQA
jgi:hypothetical protein